jgi:RHH-type rel operon transcriptional repressor/antitoxin RelB
MVALHTMYYRSVQGDTSMSRAISIRIPDKLAQELDVISKDTERPKSYHIQKALESYLEERADLQVALDRLHDTTDPVVPLNDMRKKLGI